MLAECLADVFSYKKASCKEIPYPDYGKQVSDFLEISFLEKAECNSVRKCM